jgi:hypothetical protein
MAVDGYSLLTSFALNGAICLACLAIFSFLREFKTTKVFYAPKRSVSIVAFFANSLATPQQGAPVKVPSI